MLKDGAKLIRLGHQQLLFAFQSTHSIPHSARRAAHLTCQHHRYHSTFNTIKEQTGSSALRKAIDHGNINQARIAYNTLITNNKQSNIVDRNVVRKLLMLARHGKRSDDLDFMNNILRDMNETFHIKPLHFEFHALIYAYGVQRQLDKAYAVLDYMRAKGVPPSLYSYNTLLGCFKRSNELDRAKELLKEMKRNGIKPDAVTYNTMMSLLLRKDRFGELFDMYHSMTTTNNVQPDVYTYSIMFDACVKSKNITLGKSVYAQLLNNIKPKDIDLNIINNMFRVLADVDMNKVLDLYYALETRYPHIRPDQVTFNILLDVCLKNQNPSKAYMIFEDMKRANFKPDIITYGILIDAESKNGDLKSAIQLFKDMCQKSVEPNDRILNSLVNIASSKSVTLSDLDHLVALIERYQQKLKLDTKAYNSLMYGLALNGRSNQVQKIYDTVFRHNTCEPDIATFTHLILAYINDNHLDDALEIYYVLREHHKKCRDSNQAFNVKVPIKLDTTFFSTLIASLSQQEDPQPSFTVTDVPDDSSPRLITALTLFNDMRPLQIQPTVHTYTAMLHACGQYRDRYVLDQIHQRIKVDLYLDPDIGIYNALIDAYNRTGEGEMVLEIYRTLSLSHATSVAVPDQTTVSIVLDSCGHNGIAASRAEWIWTNLKRNGFKLNTNNYNSYIECLCRSERGKEGWEKAKKMVEEDMSTPKKVVLGKPVLDEKTLNTLISFARKKGVSSEQVESLEKWKSSLFK